MDSSDLLNSEIIEALTPVEREAILKIINQIQDTGNSELYNEMLNEDYEEIPVDIDTFIEDDMYIGKITQQGTTIYPYWRNMLRQIFDPNHNYNECLAGDTLIPLMNGTKKTIKELVEDIHKGIKNYAYSFDLKTNRYVPGKIINGVVIGKKHIYRVTLDNGKFIDCTDNHKFLTRDKHYVMVKNLKIGDSIMPFNSYIDNQGYEHLLHPQKDGSVIDESTHKMSIKSKLINLKFGYVTHHKDFNKRNNYPENLLYCKYSDHKRYHSKHIKDYISNNHEYFCNQVSQGLQNSKNNNPDKWQKMQKLKGKKISAWYKTNAGVKHKHTIINNHRKWAKTTDGVETAKRNLKVFQDKLKANDSEAMLKHHENSIKGSRSRWSKQEEHNKAAQRIALRNSDSEMKINQKRGKLLKVASGAIATYGILNEDTYEKYRKSLAGIRPSFNKYLEVFSSFDEFEKLAIEYNHKIISIEYLRTDFVYDIEIESYHNFATDAGIIVKNCIFTGAIGLGKTTIAITAMAYILYQLLCLKNPQQFYGLQGNSKIVLAFFNVNLDLSYGVAFKKLQSMLMESPWFLAHGTVVGREEKNKRYYPDKGIEFKVGSQDTHGLGQDIFCITGDTEIMTENGIEKISDLDGQVISVLSQDNDGKITLSNKCQIIKTKEVTELYELTFDNNFTLKCTGNHRLRLSSGEYIKVEDLKIGDDIMSGGTEYACSSNFI